MKKAPLNLLLAGGLLFGTSVAAAANLGQHGSVSTPQEPTPAATTECGFDGEQDGQFEDAVAGCTDEPEADMNDMNDMNDPGDQAGDQTDDGESDDEGE